MNAETMKQGFMRRAIEEGVKGMQGGFGGPFGAVVVRDGRVIAAAHNRVTHDHDPTAHAEVVAIREACKRLSTFSLRGSELYASCEPCPMCLGAVYWARVDRLYYAAGREDAERIGFDDAHIYTELPLSPSDRSLETEQLLKDEAASMMLGWLSMPPERHY